MRSNQLTQDTTPTQVGVLSESVEQLTTLETTEWPPNKAKRLSASVFAIYKITTSNKGTRIFKTGLEDARELTERELHGVDLKLREEDFTTAGGLLYLMTDNKGKNFEFTNQILKDRR
jgi:hypothetical protein